MAAFLVAGFLSVLPATLAPAQERSRAADLGIRIGDLDRGPLNAITDVPGVLVGHATLVEGDSIRTGVTAILPHAGNVYHDKVRAAIVVGNGYGKLVGSTQVNELGELETPVLLTGTLSVFRAADALIDTLLSRPDMRNVRSINPVVGETNDGWLSDIRARPIGPRHVREALRAAGGGAVPEGSVGAGTGTRALGWKGGIGTASRRLPEVSGGYTVGVLVQTNYGGDLAVAGVRMGTLEAPADGSDSGAAESRERDDRQGGSVMIVIATDAPLAHRELERLAFRSFAGIARTGSGFSHGSGDYAIAFSTDRGAAARPGAGIPSMTDLFISVADATEEAVLNSLLMATTVRGFRGRVSEAVPVGPLVARLEAAGVLVP